VGGTPPGPKRQLYRKSVFLRFPAYSFNPIEIIEIPPISIIFKAIYQGEYSRSSTPAISSPGGNNAARIETTPSPKCRFFAVFCLFYQ
jgi:hypothetical protein